MKTSRRKTQILALVFLLGLMVAGYLFNLTDLFNLERTARPRQAFAISQYKPTNGTLNTGNDTVTPSNTNLRSYRGALAAEGAFWSVTNVNPGGLDMQLDFDGVNLNGANKLIVTYTGAYVTTARNYQVQIRDWSTYPTVTWRNMVTLEGNLSNTTQTTYTYELYDGYWQDGSNNPVSTPLDHFISEDADKRVSIRIVCSVNSTTQFNLDRINIETAIDPVYQPASFTQVQGGIPTGTYNQAQVSDNIRHRVPGTAGAPAEFYYSFNNITPFPGANAILVVSEDSGSVTNAGRFYNIRIYNFNTSSWEVLNSTPIALSTTDGNRQFAKAPFTESKNLSDYISGSGEVRVGYIRTSNTTEEVRVDRLYIMIGSVNDDVTPSETSWGTEAGGTTAAATRDLDSTAAAPATWQHTSVLEYPAGGLYYPSDNDGDGTNGEAVFASNVTMPVTVPDGALVTGIHWAARFISNNTNLTVELGAKDYSGINAASLTAGSGWRWIGARNNSATGVYTYTDSKVAATGAQLLLLADPEDYIDVENNVANLRLRTSTSATTTAGTTRDWDFAMFSYRWIQEPGRNTIRSQYKPTNGTLNTGNDTVTPSNTNLRSYRGALAAEGAFWSVTNVNPGGLDMQLDFDGVNLNGANKLIVTYTGAYVTTARNYQVQIRDWSTYPTVTWRNMVTLEGNLSNTTQTTYTYELYDGYWQDGSNNPVSTPLDHFISEDADKRVSIRIVCSVNSTTQFNLDRINIETAIDPVYQPASFTQVQGGIPTGTYNQAQVSDNIRHRVPGTAGAPAEFYYSFNNITPFPGANAILVVSEDSGSVTNAGRFYNIRIYNFNTSSWEVLNSTPIALSTTDGNRQFAKAPFTESKNLSDYISGSGEVRVGYIRTSNTTEEVRVDRLYIMIGSVNDDVTPSETSWGTEAGGTTAAATRDLDSTAAAPATWQHTSVLEYPAGGLYYPSDNDGDGTNGEAVFASNVTMPVTVPDGALVTGIHWAARFISNNTNLTVELGAKDYSGINAASLTAGSGWRWIGARNNSATGVYTYTDSKVAATGAQLLLLADPEDYIDVENNVANLRLRTSTSATTTAGTTRDWDFAMFSYRWIGAPSLSITIDETYDLGSTTPNGTNSVGFGSTNPEDTPFVVNAPTGGYAVKLTVHSNVMWDYTVQSSGDLTDGVNTIPISQLEWDVDPGTTWNPFTTSTYTISSNNAPNGPTGASYFYDYRLNILYDNEASDYSTSIVYTLLQTP